MGNFYVNYTLRTPEQQAVAALLAGRSSIVTPAQNGCVVVFDEESEDQNDEVIAELASKLSGRLKCPLLAVLNHDDDILSYQLFLNGDLMDEYDSAPGYFGEDADDQDESPLIDEPQGGNAKLLCEVFGGAAPSAVENILRKSALSDDGYAFAFERHADLVANLGISSFGVGTSYDAVKNGELPEDLDQSGLITTEDLKVSSSSLQTNESAAPDPKPGYYKVSFRAAQGLTKSIPSSWMPALWADLQCREEDLSNDFWHATAKHREEFKSLGFLEQGFKKLTRVLNPNSLDLGGIIYLDRDRVCFGQLLYNKFHVPSQNADLIDIVVSFTAIFKNEVFSCTNSLNSTFNQLPTNKVIRLKSKDAKTIYQTFVDHLKKRPDKPKSFGDSKSLEKWFDSNALEIFNDNVRRGLWVRMSDYEVAVAKKNLANYPKQV